MKNIITFEGIDGCGKSTLAGLLAADLRDIGYRVSLHREPGGTLLGEALRGLLLNPVEPTSAITETLILYAGRQHLLEEARANPDTIFILDRHVATTHVYQGQHEEALALSLLLADKLIDPCDYIATVLIESDKPMTGLGVIPDALEAKYSAKHEQMQAEYRKYILSTDHGFLFINKFDQLTATQAELLEFFHDKFAADWGRFKL